MNALRSHTMPANSRSSKSPRKTKKKAAKKATRKVAKKANKKVAKKAAKKVCLKKVAKKVGKTAARRPQGSRKKAVEVSAGARHEMIAKAAYYRAEKRSFHDGDPVADWLSCEKKVDDLLLKAAR